MKKIMLTFFVLLMTLTLSFNTTDSVQAQSNTYEQIDIEVQLQDDGSANIKEVWLANLEEGTENYIVKENLGKSTIENFTVTEDGTLYEFLKNWNIDASREEKTFKNGIVKTDNGVELSWGIGDYGRHEYVLEYRVTNIVKQLKDSQMLFWTFSTEGVNVPRHNVRVEIEAPNMLSHDNENIWAFGFPGDIEFSNGKIVAQTDNVMYTEDYLTVLVQFQDGTFSSSDKINKSFNKIQEEAFKGSDYDTMSAGFFQKVFNVIKTSISFIFTGLFVLVLFFLSKKYSGKGTNVGSPRKFRRQYKEEYYRDYPYEGDYINTYYMTYLMGLSSFNTILTALLLKWIYEDKIVMFESTSGMFNRKTQVIQFLTEEADTSSSEGQLFKMLNRVTDNEGKITDRQLAKWAEKNYQALSTWEKNIMKESTEILKTDDLLDMHEKKILFFTNTKYELTDSGKEVEKKIYKYVNYLHDFSLLNEHDAINVKLWDEIMIWAAFLNLTDVVSKQFSKMYPKYHEETKYKEDTLRRTSHMANEVERNRRRRERAEQKRRSSGGGGRASRGGGGGSFGGGRGGGTR